MSIAPRPTPEYIAFAQAHGPVFVANAAAIGVPPATAAAFNTAADNLSKLLAAQVAAQEAARAATATLDEAVRQSRRALSDIVRMVRVKAAASPDPTAVYNAANLPAPGAPTPLPPPGLPRDFTISVVPSSGAVVLKWKCTNPEGAAGTAYLVQRKLTQTAAPQFVGIAGGDKTFTDATLPMGTDAVIYMVTGQRSGVAGPTAECNVRFGAAGGPGLAVWPSSATVVPSNSAKMAA